MNNHIVCILDLFMAIFFVTLQLLNLDKTYVSTLPPYPDTERVPHPTTLEV